MRAYLHFDTRVGAGKKASLMLKSEIGIVVLIEFSFIMIGPVRDVALFVQDFVEASSLCQERSLGWFTGTDE